MVAMIVSSPGSAVQIPKSDGVVIHKGGHTICRGKGAIKRHQETLAERKRAKREFQREVSIL